jgi:hypothetical protein
MPPYVVKMGAEGGVTSVQINAGLLSTPSKRYNSSIAYASVEANLVSLFFGERWPGEQKLSSGIWVRIPSKAIRSSLYEANPSFIPGLLELAKTRGLFEAVTKINPEDYPGADRRALENASVITVSYAEETASIYFYSISPMDYNRFSTDKRTNFVTPILEVVLSTGLLAGLVDSLILLIPREKSITP